MDVNRIITRSAQMASYQRPVNRNANQNMPSGNFNPLHQQSASRFGSNQTKSDTFEQGKPYAQRLFSQFGPNAI